MFLLISLLQSIVMKSDCTTVNSTLHIEREIQLLNIHVWSWKKYTNKTYTPVRHLCLFTQNSILELFFLHLNPGRPILLFFEGISPLRLELWKGLDLVQTLFFFFFCHWKTSIALTILWKHVTENQSSNLSKKNWIRSSWTHTDPLLSGGWTPGRGLCKNWGSSEGSGSRTCRYNPLIRELLRNWTDSASHSSVQHTATCGDCELKCG